MSAEKTLSGLKFEDLKSVVFERLHRRQSIGPLIDPRGDYPPYAWLLDAYEKGSDALRSRMNRAAKELLKELPDTDAWPAEARGYLLNFISEGQLAASTVDKLIRSQTLLHAPGAGPEAHAALFRCTAALGLSYSTDIWLAQLKIIGDDAGGMVFGGLLTHGLDTAIKHLRECCTNEENAITIGLYIPALVPRLGLEIVGKAFESALAGLPAWARNELVEALEVEGYVVATAESWQYDLDAHLEACFSQSPQAQTFSSTWDATLVQGAIANDLVQQPALASMAA